MSNDPDRDRMFALVWPLAFIIIGLILLFFTGCAAMNSQHPLPAKSMTDWPQPHGAYDTRRPL